MSNHTASTLGSSSKAAAASKPDIRSRAVQLPLNDSTTLLPSTRACHPWPVMDDLRVIANPRVCALYFPRAIAPEMKAQGRRGGRRGKFDLVFNLVRLDGAPTKTARGAGSIPRPYLRGLPVRRNLPIRSVRISTAFLHASAPFCSGAVPCELDRM